MYFDSSGLVKRYAQGEVGARVVSALWARSARFTSVVATIEVRAALARKRREGVIGKDDLARLADAIRLDEEELHFVDLSLEVRLEAHRLVDRHVLRTLDAIHLASALAVARRDPPDFTVVTADDRLAAAARAEGLTVVVPK